MQIHEFMDQHPGHPLTEVLSSVRHKCTQAEYDRARGMAAGMAMLLTYQGHLTEEQFFSMMKGIANFKQPANVH